METTKQENEIRLLKEDLYCVNKYLDELDIPKRDEKDTFSIVGRIKQLEKRNLIELSNLETEYLKSKWINVKEKMPEMGERVLVFCKSQGIQMCYNGYHNNGVSWMMAYDMSKAELNITHWMPLPELPRA